MGNHAGENMTEPYQQPTLPTENTAYTYNDANQILTAGSTAFTHDGDGNVRTKGNKTYSYDLEDNLTEIKENGVIIATFKYDAFGNRRVAKRGAVETHYILDLIGLADVLAETDASNNIQNYYIHGMGLVARVKPDGTLHYYHGDYRGSIIAMTDASQTITHQYQYDEFGNILALQEADENRFRYVGAYGIMYERDDLFYMRARYYDSTTGRFNGADPIWSSNLYPYANNNGVMNIDPTGEIPLVIFGIAGVVGIVGGAISAYSNGLQAYDNGERNGILLSSISQGFITGFVGTLTPVGAFAGGLLDAAFDDINNRSIGKEVAPISNYATAGIKGLLLERFFEKVVPVKELSKNPIIQEAITSTITNLDKLIPNKVSGKVGNIKFPSNYFTVGEVLPQPALPYFFTPTTIGNPTTQPCNEWRRRYGFCK
jgi:RHS repeat-associated protein